MSHKPTYYEYRSGEALNFKNVNKLCADEAKRFGSLVIGSLSANHRLGVGLRHYGLSRGLWAISVGLQSARYMCVGIVYYFSDVLIMNSLLSTSSLVIHVCFKMSTYCGCNVIRKSRSNTCGMDSYVIQVMQKRSRVITVDRIPDLAATYIELHPFYD